MDNEKRKMELSRKKKTSVARIQSSSTRYGSTKERSTSLHELNLVSDYCDITDDLQMDSTSLCRLSNELDDSVLLESGSGEDDEVLHISLSSKF